MAITTSMSFAFGLRQAAPMQKRVAPPSLAALAEVITSSTAISASRSKPVSKWALCEQ